MKAGIHQQASGGGVKNPRQIGTMRKLSLMNSRMHITIGILMVSSSSLCDPIPTNSSNSIRPANLSTTTPSPIYANHRMDAGQDTGLSPPLTRVNMSQADRNAEETILRPQVAVQIFTSPNVHNQSTISSHQNRISTPERPSSSAGKRKFHRAPINQYHNHPHHSNHHHQVIRLKDQQAASSNARPIESSWQYVTNVMDDKFPLPPEDRGEQQQTREATATATTTTANDSGSFTLAGPVINAIITVPPSGGGGGGISGDGNQNQNAHSALTSQEEQLARNISAANVERAISHLLESQASGNLEFNMNMNGDEIVINPVSKHANSLLSATLPDDNFSSGGGEQQAASATSSLSPSPVTNHALYDSQPATWSSTETDERNKPSPIKRRFARLTKADHQQQHHQQSQAASSSGERSAAKLAAVSSGRRQARAMRQQQQQKLFKDEDSGGESGGDTSAAEDDRYMTMSNSDNVDSAYDQDSYHDDQDDDQDDEPDARQSPAESKSASSNGGGGDSTTQQNNNNEPTSAAASISKNIKPHQQPQRRFKSSRSSKRTHESDDDDSQVSSQTSLHGDTNDQDNDQNSLEEPTGGSKQRRSSKAPRARQQQRVTGGSSGRRQYKTRSSSGGGGGGASTRAGNTQLASEKSPQVHTTSRKHRQGDKGEQPGVLIRGEDLRRFEQLLESLRSLSMVNLGGKTGTYRASYQKQPHKSTGDDEPASGFSEPENQNSLQDDMELDSVRPSAGHQRRHHDSPPSSNSSDSSFLSDCLKQLRLKQQAESRKSASFYDEQVEGATKLSDDTPRQPNGDSNNNSDNSEGNSRKSGSLLSSSDLDINEADGNQNSDLEDSQLDASNLINTRSSRPNNGTSTLRPSKPSLPGALFVRKTILQSYYDERAPQSLKLNHHHHPHQDDRLLSEIDNDDDVGEESSARPTDKRLQDHDFSLDHDSSQARLAKPRASSTFEIQDVSSSPTTNQRQQGQQSVQTNAYIDYNFLDDREMYRGSESQPKSRVSDPKKQSMNGTMAAGESATGQQLQNL